MKATKITYWILTGLVSLMMAFSAYKYLTDPTIDAGFKHLGFPSYFRIELAIAKLIAAVLLLAPVAARVKEWTYSALGIVFISAFIAHTASADPVANRVMPVVFLLVLIGSYLTYHKVKTVVK